MKQSSNEPATAVFHQNSIVNILLKNPIGNKFSIADIIKSIDPIGSTPVFNEVDVLVEKSVIFPKLGYNYVIRRDNEGNYLLKKANFLDVVSFYYNRVMY